MPIGIQIALTSLEPDIMVVGQTMNRPTIETERLILRPFVLPDGHVEVA